MAFKTSVDGTLASAKGGFLASKSGIPAMYGSGDLTTLPSNEIKVTAFDGSIDDYFGTAVATGNGRVVVGVPHDDNPNGTFAGAAYIFDLDGNLITKIIASDGRDNDGFGVKLSVGCNRIVISAVSGSYIFDLDGNQLDKTTGSGTYFAVGCGIIANGSYILDLDGNQLATITPLDGASLSGGFAGRVGCGRIVVGNSDDTVNGSYSGSAYIFDLDGNQLAKITASDAAAYDFFGFRVAVGSGRIVSSAYGAGAAYIFDLDGNQLAKVTSPEANDQFGYSIAVGSGRIVVGAGSSNVFGYSSGLIYIYDLDGNLLDKMLSSDIAIADSFGDSVAVGSGRIVVGSTLDDDKGSRSGSAYIYNTPNVITPYDVQDWERG